MRERFLPAMALVAVAGACARGATDGAGFFVASTSGTGAEPVDPSGDALPAAPDDEGAALMLGPPETAQPIVESVDATSAAAADDSDAAADLSIPSSVGPSEDASTSDGAGAVVEVSPVHLAQVGDLLITEVMYAPSGATPESEWFELFNTARWSVALSGLTIEDGAFTDQTIPADPPVVISSGAYVLLVRDRATALQNGLPRAAIAYEYGGPALGSASGVQLTNDAAGAISLYRSDTLLASVPYGTWELAALGQSLELATLQLVGSDTSSTWCFAEAPWAPGADFGTPGRANDCLGP